ncbi:MAG: 30S ribosomal protein S3 [Acidilobaceae archaeon]|nr:30S ribosomal protein S3 [Acidilobaceae archaeon]MDW7974692.1 30S ribosomal protein S3 [Sulfolobales archaeon]
MSYKVKKYFLGQALLRVKLDEFLAQNFYEAGYSNVSIAKTGLGTRVHIFAERPALIIGRRGATVRELQRAFSNVFNLENPQITVSPPENAELDARVQAFRIAKLLERGYHFRRVAFAALRRIMANGALGAEITISGKIVAERAKFEKYKEGKVYKAGHVVDELVDKAISYAKLPKGIIGVEVIITKPGSPPDYVRIKEAAEVQEFVSKVREEVKAKGLPVAEMEEIEEVIAEEEEEPVSLEELEEVEKGGSEAQA